MAAHTAGHKDWSPEQLLKGSDLSNPELHETENLCG